MIDREVISGRESGVPRGRCQNILYNGIQSLDLVVDAKTFANDLAPRSRKRAILCAILHNVILYVASIFIEVLKISTGESSLNPEKHAAESCIGL